MTTNKMLELLLLCKVLEDYDKDDVYREFVRENYDSYKIQNRYTELGKEFLNEYALNKTEKSEENL